MTATHQLKTDVTSLAYVGRALFLACLLASPQNVEIYTGDSFMNVVAIPLSNALLGMDANDPPKTLATMQLIGSIFSNLIVLGDNEDAPLFLQSLASSEWLGTFLVEDTPYYFYMLEVLIGKLSKPLFNQALKKISRFVNANILPGATAEVGLLCCACEHSNPEDSAANIIKPLLQSVTSSLQGTPSSTKATLSPALEIAVEYHLKVLAIAISYAGPQLLHHKDELKEGIASAFQALSWKVNGAGHHVLHSLL